MFHQEVEEEEEVAEEEAEVVVEEETPKEVEAEDKMPNRLSRLQMTISQLCETEDLFDLNQESCLIHHCSFNGV